MRIFGITITTEDIEELQEIYQNEFETLNTKNRELENELMEANAEIDKIKTAQNNQKHIIKQQKDTINSLNDIISSLEMKLKAIKEEQKEINIAKNEEITTIEDLQEEINTLNNTINSLEITLNKKDIKKIQEKSKVAKTTKSKDTIQKTILFLKSENKNISEYNISKYANMSINTVKKYRTYIHDILKETIKETISFLKSENKTINEENISKHSKISINTIKSLIEIN